MNGHSQARAIRMESVEHAHAFAGWMTDVRLAVERRLRAFFDDERRALEARAAAALPLLDTIEDLTMRGGKRFRPALLAAAFHAVDTTTSATPADRAARSVIESSNAGAALELLQTYLLIHDDWMDGDAVRRGGPSAHVLLGRAHVDSHEAASAAILAGDLACAWSWRLLLEPRVESPSSDRLVACARALASVSDEVTLGQYLDVAATSEVETVHLLKTASYTTRGPLRIGALLAGASETQIETLDRFGAAIGVAFQLRDDVLGVFGDPALTGKPSGNDLRAGKRTMLVIETERRGDSTQREALRRVLGRRDASDEEVRAAIDGIERSGARAVSEERIESLHRESIAALDRVGWSDGGYTLMAGAADLLVRRAQ